jgi:RNA polymerase sigma factor (TIGR02999 family)
MSDVTRILSQIESGEPKAAEQLLPLVYDQLRRLAARELSRESAGHTLQPTALVHEAYVRLVDREVQPKWSHRGHFYAAAAEAMRRILVEYARQKKTLKRGGDRKRQRLDADQIPCSADLPDLLAIDEALTQLAIDRPELAQLVSLRYFAGLSMEQAAKSLQISLRTAERHWTYAKAWLLQAIADQG